MLLVDLEETQTGDTIYINPNLVLAVWDSAGGSAIQVAANKGDGEPIMFYVKEKPDQLRKKFAPA